MLLGLHDRAMTSFSHTRPERALDHTCIPAAAEVYRLLNVLQACVILQACVDNRENLAKLHVLAKTCLDTVATTCMWQYIGRDRSRV